MQDDAGTCQHEFAAKCLRAMSVLVASSLLSLYPVLQYGFRFNSPQGSEVPVPRCPAQQVPEVPGSGSTARSDGGPLSV